MRKQKQPGHNIGRSRPSIAYELKYRKTLQSLVAEMRADIQKVLEEYQRKHVYDASSPLRMIFSKLRDKWYIRFEKVGRVLAQWFAEATDKRTKKQISRKMKEVGWTLSPNYNSTDKTLILEIINNNIELIKTIPQQYLHNLQKVVTQAFIEGGNMGKITKVIEHIGTVANNRAALIARDQTNKATQQLAAVNAKAFGATKGRWIHVPGKYSSRRTHIAMDKKVFLLDEGLYDSSVGRNVKPGELIYCNCQFEVLLPGFDD
jgi:uncharacterized protein with gpF-like domain